MNVDSIANSEQEEKAYKEQVKKVILKRVKDIESSSKGPLWTQWVLASYLKTDPMKEVDRFKLTEGRSKKSSFSVQLRVN